MKPELELVYEASGALDPPILVGDTPHGTRRIIPIPSGPFEGPQMRGRVLPGGADWQVTRADGVTEVEALYLLETDDGARIQVRNRGLRHGPQEVMRRMAAGETVDPGAYYFRTAPEFSAPAGRYDWLNRNLFVCAGARFPDAIRLWVYRVT